MDKILEICKVVFLGIIAITLIFVVLSIKNLSCKFISQNDIKEHNATTEDMPTFRVEAIVEVEQDVRNW